ncbi:MAG: hypothetical protein M1828_001521 [Chrysothrix sp. TS-e1954]|nr:MAG: hypothetical protein M1828_001521 [Chrysothrix sp. TS-e1954]
MAATTTTAPSTTNPSSQSAHPLDHSNPLPQSKNTDASAVAFPDTTTTAWHTPGPSTFDLRSDTITTPTLPMLTSIAQTTLQDDVFLEDPTTTHLESFCADLTGKEAGLLVMSGTMGNQVALRAHLTSLPGPSSVLLDKRSHIYGWEAGGLSSANGALALPMLPRESEGAQHLSLEDIKREAVLSDDVHACPTRVICLENTLAGTILPLSTAQGISTWTSTHNAHTPSQQIALHLDGARLWEAAAASSPSREAQLHYLRSYSENFSSVSLCFSKGLGAPIGSVLVGSTEFIKRARHFRKAFGGGTRQAGIIAAPALVGVRQTFLEGKLRKSHEDARRVADIWEAVGGRLERPTETNMVWCDLEAAGVGREEWVDACGREGVRVMGGRLVVHYQIGEECLGRLERAMRRVMGKGGEMVMDGGFHVNGNGVASGVGLGTSGADEVPKDAVERNLEKMKLNVE